MSTQKKILFSIVGARPNFMKMASIHRAITQQNPGTFAHKIVHTGQHFSPEMSSEIFDDLQLPKPDFHFDISGGSSLQQIAKGLEQLEKLFSKEKPHMVIAYGDVNSTAAAAITASRLGIPLAHVEAGLRSFDRGMPEELNRMLTDAVSDYAFTTEPEAEKNLLKEGWKKERIFFVGNTMIDTLIFMLDKAIQLPMAEDSFYLCTLHRPSNVDQPENLSALLKQLALLNKKLILPLHPRTKANIEKFGLQELLKPFKVMAPLRYSHFVQLLKHSKGIITDSGGIQEESTYLGIPCVTLRENTERPITISMGTNILLDPTQDKLATAIEAHMGKAKPSQTPPLWDGKAGQRIIENLQKILV